MIRRRVLMLVLAMGTLGLLTFSGFFWDILAIRKVVIEGGERITRDDVRRLVDIEVGENLFLADLHAAKARLQAQPWVESVDVTRRYPNLHITLKERWPFAVVSIPEAGSLWCDEEGYVLAPFESERATMVISGMGKVRPTDQGPRVGTAAQWDVVRLLLRSDLTFLSDEIVQVRLNVAGAELITQANRRIRLPLRDTATALRRLRALWPTLEKRISFQTLDLRFPGEIVYEATPH